MIADDRLWKYLCRTLVFLEDNNYTARLIWNYVNRKETKEEAA